MTITQISPTTPMVRCLCGKELGERRRYDGRRYHVHTSTGKVECYPQSLNPEDASYYRATPDDHTAAA